MEGYILAVDDDTSMRALLRSHLEATGRPVRVVASAGAAEELALRAPPALIVSDVRLRVPSHIPVIYIGAGHPGAAEHLAKPLCAEALLAAVRRQLREPDIMIVSSPRWKRPSYNT